ncbi:MAG: hypothetical protein ACREP6_04195, partial [Candidatus Binataceae bacterium]
MLFRIAILAAAVILLSASPKPLLAASGSISVSAGLTDYLHSHRLPAVGAKITTAENGVRTVMLYGFVATERGYHDAELRTRHYLHDAKLQ